MAARRTGEAHLVETVSRDHADRVERDDEERRGHLIMIESMQRAGYSEQEITRAVDEAAAA